MTRCVQFLLSGCHLTAHGTALASLKNTQTLTEVSTSSFNTVLHVIFHNQLEFDSTSTALYIISIFAVYWHTGSLFIKFNKYLCIIFQFYFLLLVIKKKRWDCLSYFRRSSSSSSYLQLKCWALAICALFLRVRCQRLISEINSKLLFSSEQYLQRRRQGCLSPNNRLSHHPHPDHSLFFIGWPNA